MKVHLRPSKFSNKIVSRNQYKDFFNLILVKKYGDYIIEYHNVKYKFLVKKE